MSLAGRTLVDQMQSNDLDPLHPQCFGVLTYLVQNHDRLVPIGEIARDRGLSHNSLMKMVVRLSQAGLLETVRGRAGG